MKNNKHTLSPFLKGEGFIPAFTLVEMLVSMTIFSMIMVSVIMIYANASDISTKYDITREMRQNIKSVVEDISEEVRKNQIVGVKNDYLGTYNFSNGSGSRLKVGDIEYKIQKFEYNDLSNEDNFLDCSDIKNICKIYKFKNGVEVGPLSNSKVSFTNLKFSVSGENKIPKVTLQFTARATVRSGIRANLAEKTKLIFQTTFSERLLKVK